MIKIKFWDNKEDSWEKELWKPNYKLKVSWKLKSPDIYFSFKNDLENDIKFSPELDKCKVFSITNQPCCLNDEEIEAFLILGAKPLIGINLDTIPNYLQELRDDIYHDLLNNLEEDLLECFNNKNTIEDLYNTIPMEIKKLKSFPKEFQKEPIYYYGTGDIRPGLLAELMPENNCWSTYDIYYKVIVSGSCYFVHLKHTSGQSNLARVYSYEDKKAINSKINEQLIIELLIYNIWKKYSKV